MNYKLIRLIPFDQSHFDALIEWTSTSEFLLQWAGPGLTFPLDHKQLNQLLVSARSSPPGAYLFSAQMISDNTVIGHGEIGAVDRRNLNAKLMRILIGPESARGRGIGKQLVQELVRVGFEELGLHRLDLNVFDFNRSAIHCYERVGFKLEGTLREARRHDGQYWNSCIMGLLRSEWSSAQPAHRPDTG